MREKSVKKNVINSIGKQFSDNNCFYVVDLFGIKVCDIEKFRKECRTNNVFFQIVKNSLIHIALNESNIENIHIKEINKNSLKKMSGLLFVKEQYNSPAKIIAKFKKDITNGDVKLKCAYVEGSLFFGDDKLEVLKSLKSKNELIADVVLSLHGGITNIISGLSSSKNKICEILESLKKR